VHFVKNFVGLFFDVFLTMLNLSLGNGPRPWFLDKVERRRHRKIAPQHATEEEQNSKQQ